MCIEKLKKIFNDTISETEKSLFDKLSENLKDRYIAARWQVEEKENCFICYNGYHCFMNGNIDDGWVNFKIRFDKKISMILSSVFKIISIKYLNTSFVKF